MNNILSTKEHINYINHQKIKTTNLEKQKKWLGEEWELKKKGFVKIFKQYLNVFDKNAKCVCLGSRTGQEVAALIEVGFNDSIGIDIVPFEPYTIQADFHSLPFEDNSISLIYTNAVDHVRLPEIWSNEIKRVLKNNGYLLMNIQINMGQDEYSVYHINNPEKDLIQPYFDNYLCLKNEQIPCNIHAMNWEILLKSVKTRQ